MLRLILFAAVLFGLAGITASKVSAVTYGMQDCQDNATNAGCKHPNTVSLSGFRVGADGALVSSGRCSGSLLSKDDDKIVILTAGHCAELYLSSLQNGALANVGVSFDAQIARYPGTTVWPADQYILGGQPVVPAEYGPVNAYNPQFDYGVIVFAVPAGGLVTDNGTPVDLSDIYPVYLPSLGFLEGKVSATTPLSLTAVGYGPGEAHNKPGQGGRPSLVARRRVGQQCRPRALCVPELLQS